MVVVMVIEKIAHQSTEISTEQNIEAFRSVCTHFDVEQRKYDLTAPALSSWEIQVLCTHPPSSETHYSTF